MPVSFSILKMINLLLIPLSLFTDNNSILSGPVIVHALALIYRTREIQEQQILHGQYSHQQQHLEHQHSHQHQHSQKQHLEQQHSQQQSTQFHECLYCKIRINRATKHIMQPGQEYELFCVVLMESHKMMEDWAFHCLGWSKLAHLSNTDLIKWERQFLRVIGFDVGVSRVLFDEWILYVCRVASGLGLSEFDNRLIWSSVLKVRKR